MTMKTFNYLTKLPQEATIKKVETFRYYDLITLEALRLFLVFLLFSPVFLISSPVYLEDLLSFLGSPQSFSLSWCPPDFSQLFSFFWCS